MTTLASPDLFNVYSRVPTGLDGNVVLSYALLHLPAKASYIIFQDLPVEGSIVIDGLPVESGETVISVTDINNNLLVWQSGLLDSTLTLDISYYGFDESDHLISLLDVYYPPDTVEDVYENVVNGGNFKTGEAGFGVSPDGGDFDTGLIVANGYSYDGGDFDTGERVGIAPPPASDFNLYEDGQLDPETDSIITLLDENLQPIQTSELPNSQYLVASIVMPDLLFNLDYSVELEVAYVTKFFEGFDYGSIPPNFGYDIDYGTVDSENTEGYDFNTIVGYEEPVPGNVAS